MRALLRASYLQIAGVIKSPKSGIHILNGHFLTRKTHTGTEKFEKLLRKMRNFSEFIKIEDATKLITSNEAKNFNGLGIAFTFDDGFLDCYTALAPTLDKFNTNACFFINPGFVDGDLEYKRRMTEDILLTPGKQPMTWENIQELHSNGFIIGNHTTDHYRLNTNSHTEISEQILDSKNKIEKRLGADVDYFAWPFGQESDINHYALNVACNSHKYIFSGFGYKNYKSFDDKVINRRHFEADWPINYLKYFLSFGKN